MSFLDLNLGDVPDLETLADGEYELRITKAEIKEYSNEKGSGTFISLSFDVPSEPNAKGIYHTLFMPKPGDTEKDRNDALRKIKEFAKAFDIPLQGFDVNEILGKMGWCILTTKSTEDYGDQNRIRRFITGH